MSGLPAILNIAGRRGLIVGGGSVALRPEPFGAMAYDFHTRRLTFLKTPQLVDVVRRLAGRVDRCLDAKVADFKQRRG